MKPHYSRCLVVGVIALTAFCSSAFSEEKINKEQACITLVSDSVDLEVVKVSEGAKQMPSGKKLVVLQPVTADKWEVFSVTFKASADTMIKFRLSGAYSKDVEAPVYVDNVVGTGVDIKGGDFESASNGKITGWQMSPDKDGKKATLKNEAGKAASGSNYVRTTYSTPVMQNIQIAAGQEATITVSGRLATE